MIYNKRNLRKVEDKKVLRKVKSQWVVVSLASFGLIAGIGAVQHVSVYAAENQQVSADSPSDSQASTGDSASTSASTSTSTSASTSASASASTSTSTSTSASASASASASTSASNAANNSSASNPAPAVPDTPDSYKAQIAQGQQDGYAGNADASASLSGRAADYYEAAYKGAKNALAAYTANTTNQGTGTQDYTFYGNTALKKDGTAQSGPTDGSPQADGSADNPNQGGANDPQSATTSSKTYEDALNNKLVSSANTSVQVNGKTISIPNTKTSGLQGTEAYPSDSNLATAFSDGVAYALAQQGQQDAETGKWQGVSGNTATTPSTTTTDQYLSANPTADTSNPYDQAYRGARDAMNAYFNSAGGYIGNNTSVPFTSGTTYYNQGFQDVVNQAGQQGIAYVQNQSQYWAVLNSLTSGNNNVKTIRLANDIYLSNYSNGENNVNATGSAQRSLTIDGQNHLMDTRGVSLTISNTPDVYIQNFQTLYGTNWYGPFRVNDYKSIHFGNLNYVGPQLLSAQNNNSYFFGNVNVIDPNRSGDSYDSPFQTQASMEGSGDQQNLVVNNFVLESGAHYFGTTSPWNGGMTVIVYGNFTLNPDSKMTLITRGKSGGSGENNNFANSAANYGVTLYTSGSSLNIQKDATLNVIGKSLTGDKSGGIGSGVYANSGATININGGTLNYEGYQGEAGSANQAIVSAGNAKINVTNNGLLQAMVDSLPSNATSSNGLVYNPGNSTFNIGSKGSMQIGITGSSDNNTVPYNGPISINSVGGNHVVLIRPNTQTPFQTGGNNNSITAYTVAVTQKDSNGNVIKTNNLYQYNLPSSASGNWTGTDMNGQKQSGTVDGTTLDIINVPAVQVVGPLTKTTNSDGTTTVTGYVKLSNYTDLKDKDGNPAPLYVAIASGSGDVSDYTKLTQVTPANVTDSISGADQNVYNTSMSTDDYTGGLLPVVLTIPKGVSADSVGMRFHYGVNSVTTVLTPSQYQTTVEAYKPDGNGKVVADPTGNIPTAQGAQGAGSPSAKALTDAATDAKNNNNAQQKAEDINTSSDPNYTSNYNSYKSGYTDFANQPADQDVTKTAGYQNADSPSAYLQGYNDGAYQAGIKDAQSGKNSGSVNTQYQQALKDYDGAKSAANTFTPGQAPAAPTGSSPAAAQAYTDAQGAATFFKDEAAGTIHSTSYNALTDAQKTNYDQAYAGYTQAGKVSPTATNPDTTASPAEQQGFDYGQSLINGGLLTSAPTSATSNIKYLSAATLGYNTAQAAIKQAQGNGKTSAEAQATDPTQLSTDNQKASTDGTNGADLTFYRSVKFGNYAAQNTKSDDGLDQYAEVGYYQYVSPQAYQDGVAAGQRTDGNETPSGDDDKSNAAKAAYAKGYNDAQNGTADGIQRFLNGTAAATSTDPNAAGVTTSSNTAQSNATKGFTDANSNPAVTDPTLAKDKGYVAGQNAAKAAQQAAADVANDTDNRDSVTDKASYDVAKQAYQDGENAAATAAKTGGTAAAPASKNPAYIQAYNQAVSDAAKAQEDYNKGVNEAATNTAPADSASASEKKGAADFNKGLSDAVNNPSSIPTPANSGEQAGQAAADKFTTGYNDAKNGHTETDVNDPVQAAANKGGQEGFADALANTSRSTDGMSPVEKIAYQKATTDAAAAAKQGADAFANGSGRPTGETPADKVAQAAYDKAQQGYADAKDKKAPTNPADADNPAYKAGQAAYDAGQAGAKSSTEPTTAGPEKDGYDGNKDGAADALAGNPEKTDFTGKSQAYQDAYTNAYNAAKNGLNDGGSAAAGTAADSTKYSDPNYKQGYDAAQAAKQAEADAANGSNNRDSVNDKAAYDAAKQAYQDGKNAAAAAAKTGGTPAAPQSSNPVYVQAYKQAVTDAANQADYQKGVDEAKSGQTPADSASASEKQGAEDFNTGFNGGNGASIANPTAGQKAGMDAAAALNTAVTDAKTGNPDDSQDSDQVKAAAYNTAAEAYKDVAAGTPKTNDQINALDPVSKAAYTKALADANAAAKQGQDAFANGTGRPTGDTPADKAAEAGYDRAQQGYNDAKNKTTSPNANPDDPSYKAGQTAYAAGQTGAKSATEPTTAGPEKDGYDGNQNGAADALAGKDKEADLATKSQAYQDAYNNAYNAAKQGLDDGGNGKAADATKAGDPNYKQGYDAAQAGKQGAADAANGVDNSAKSANPDAYKKAQGAYQEGEKAAADAAKTNTKPAETTNTDPVYKQAYDQALTDTANKADYQKGVDEAKSGQTPADSASASEKQGAADFNKGLTDAVNNPSSTPANAGEQAGKDAVANIDTAVTDAKTGNPDDSQSSDPVKKTAYNAAADAYKDVAAGTPKSTDQINALDPVSKAAYTKALTDAQNSAADGEKAYLSGQARPDDSTPAGKAAAAAYDKAKQGYADAAAGKTTDADKNDPAYLAGQKAYTDGQTGYNGTSAPTDNAPQATKDAYNGATSGAADAVAGKAKPTDLATKSLAYQNAYNKAYDQAQAGIADATAGTQPTDAQKADPNYETGYDAAKKAAQSGSQAYLNGQARPDDSTPTGKAAAAAYDKAKQGYTDAAAGKTTDADQNDPAYLAGKKAYTDGQTGYNGTTAPADNASQQTKDAYNGATSGAADAVAGKAKPSDLASKSQAYQVAYNKAYDQAQAGMADATAGTHPTDAQKADPNYMTGYNAAQNAADSGAQAFLNGQARPDDSTPAGKAAAAAYDAAKNGYNGAAADAQSGKEPTDAEKNDPAYMKGYQAYKDSQTGYTGAGTDTKPADNAPQAAKDAYNGGVAGAKDGAAGAPKESDLSTKSQAYQDAYNKAYADAAAGAQAGYQDGSQSGTPTDLTNKSAIFKQAYAAAKAKADAEATAGAADFAQGKSAPTTATAASQYGYDRAKAGFDDANAGKPAQANDAAYMAGYNAGLKHYTTTNNTAQDDALSGKGRQDANLDDADKAAYDQAYARTIAGLNDGANGSAKAFPDDANYLKGYAAGEAVKALLADKQNNTTTAVADQASYDLANQGYLQAQDDVKNGRAKAPNNQNPIYVLAYDLAYDQLLKEKEAQGTATSAQPTATTTSTQGDNVTPATKSSDLPATGEEKTATNNSGLILGLAASFFGLFAAAKRNKRDEK